MCLVQLHLNGGSFIKNSPAVPNLHNSGIILSVDQFNPISCLSVCLGRDSFQEEVVQAGSKGFIGCLSSVQFNHVAPLKAALLNRGSSLVTIRGPLVQSNCGALADSITSHNLRGNTHCQSSSYIQPIKKPLSSTQINYLKLFGVPPSWKSVVADRLLLVTTEQFHYFCVTSVDSYAVLCFCTKCPNKRNRPDYYLSKCTEVHSTTGQEH